MNFKRDAKQMLLYKRWKKQVWLPQAGAKTGTVKIGYVSMHSELPTLLASFLLKENQNISYISVYPADLLHGLNAGTLDVAFIRTWLRIAGKHTEDFCAQQNHLWQYCRSLSRWLIK